MWKLGYEEVKELAYRASKWQSRNLNPGSVVSKASSLTAVPYHFVWGRWVGGQAEDGLMAV